MAMHQGKRYGPWKRLWAASITAALSLNGASAWAQSYRVLPPCPTLVVTGPARIGAPAGAPQLLAATAVVPDAPPAPPPADAPAGTSLILTAASVVPDVAPAPPQADAAVGAPPPLAAASVLPDAPPAPQADAPAAAPLPPETPATVTLPAWVPGALGDEPGDSEPSFATGHHPKGESKSRLSDVPIGIQPIPERPRLIVELNDHFLSPGFLSKGIELPGGDVVRPSFWVFGTNQFGYNYFNNKTRPAIANELVDRLDLFAQLNLSGTERVLFGVRPLDKERKNKRIYTSIDFQNDRSISGTNFDPETLFFEGDFGEIFPDLDLYDTKLLDYGFSVGRQPLLLQDGLLVNANQLDAVTVTRNTLNKDGVLNFRSTGMVAWDRIHRNNDIYDPSALLYGLYTETDFDKSTVNVDLIYVDAGTTTGSAFFAAASAIQRLEGPENTWNSSFHALTSVPTNQPDASTGRGTLLFAQLSMTPHSTPNLLYVTGFWAIDQFSSAARNPEVGGPLGQVGILFAAPAFGQFGAPLSNAASDVVGGAVGYQIFLDNTRKQVIFEVGARKDTNDVSQGAIGFDTRYQQACGQHSIFLIDAFVTKQEKFQTGVGARASWTIKF